MDLRNSRSAARTSMGLGLEASRPARHVAAQKEIRSHAHSLEVRVAHVAALVIHEEALLVHETEASVQVVDGVIDVMLRLAPGLVLKRKILRPVIAAVGIVGLPDTRAE